jgi:hypothetical protein
LISKKGNSQKTKPVISNGNGTRQTGILKNHSDVMWVFIAQKTLLSHILFTEESLCYTQPSCSFGAQLFEVRTKVVQGDLQILSCRLSFASLFKFLKLLLKSEGRK